jgi:hypothetical protein
VSDRKFDRRPPLTYVDLDGRPRVVRRGQLTAVPGSRFVQVLKPGGAAPSLTLVSNIVGDDGFGAARPRQGGRWAA